MILLFYLFAFDFLITTEAQTTTFDIMIKSKHTEGYSKPLDNNDGFFGIKNMTLRRTAPHPYGIMVLETGVHSIRKLLMIIF